VATTVDVKNNWRWLVCALNGHGLTNLDKLATKQSMQFVLDDTAQFTCDLPSDNNQIHALAQDASPRVAFGRRLIYGFRREEVSLDSKPWVCRFSGVANILQDQATADEPVTHLTAYDAMTWTKFLPALTPDGYLLPEKGYTYFNKTGDYIAKDVIANAYGWIISQFQFGSPARFPWPTGFGDLVNVLFIDIAGGHFDTTDIIEEFPIQQGASVYDVWQQLSQTGGLDIVLDPVYMPRDAPGRIAQLNVYTQAGSDRPGASFGWDMFPRNLIGVDHLLDGTQIENWVQFYAGGGVAPYASDPQTPGVPPYTRGSIGSYGPYFAQKNVTQGSKAAVNLLALAEVALRKRGKQTLTIDPTPELSPDPFTHYFLGDTVYVWAGRSLPTGSDAGYGTALREAIRSTPQPPPAPQISPWRVYGFQVDLADDQVETITNLLLTDPNAVSV
jgi:hypothetical protein